MGDDRAIFSRQDSTLLKVPAELSRFEEDWQMSQSPGQNHGHGYAGSQTRRLQNRDAATTPAKQYSVKNHKKSDGKEAESDLQRHQHPSQQRQGDFRTKASVVTRPLEFPRRHSSANDEG